MRRRTRRTGARARALAGSLAAALALGGCTMSGSVGGGEAADPEAQRAWLESLRVPVAQVGRLELGRSRDGYALAAFGTVEGVGWSAPMLRPRTPIVAPDGMIELDFIAVPPQPPAEPGPDGIDPTPPLTTPDRPPMRIRADRTLAPELVAEAQGVRVWAAQGPVEGRF